MSDLTVITDLAEAKARARRAASLLNQLRARHDLSPFEFTRTVRIAPLEAPAGHPVLTLGTSFNKDEDGFLAMYLNQQFRWYLTEYRAAEMAAVLPVLKEHIPGAPKAGGTWSNDRTPVYRDLVATWLEIDAVTGLIGRNRALSRLRKSGGAVRWVYQTVQRDRDGLGQIFGDYGIAPLPHAQSLAHDAAIA